MDCIPQNFYYDPIRQGTGKGVWNWYSGAPYQNGGYLVLLNGSGYMFYDCGKGSISYVLNIPHDPTDFSARQWGLRSGEDYVLFDFSGGTFQAISASTRGTRTASSVIAWDSTWTQTDTTFMIRWEAGMATFYINGIVRAVLSDASIPYGPMSPFVHNNGADLFMIESVVGQGLQSLILDPVETSSDTSSPSISTLHDSMTSSEVITITNATLPASSVSDTISASSDTVTAADSLDKASSVSETTSMTESTTAAVQMTFLRSVADTITITDVISNSHTA